MKQTLIATFSLVFLFTPFHTMPYPPSAISSMNEYLASNFFRSSIHNPPVFLSINLLRNYNFSHKTFIFYFKSMKKTMPNEVLQIQQKAFHGWMTRKLRNQYLPRIWCDCTSKTEGALLGIHRRIKSIKANFTLEDQIFVEWDVQFFDEKTVRFDPIRNSWIILFDIAYKCFL